MIVAQKRVILDRIQTYCEQWWEASSQFHNLHAVYEQDALASVPLLEQAQACS